MKPIPEIVDAMKDTGSEADRPILLSVVVPCFNEADTLLECVQRLLRIQNRQLQLEIVIVDDCSTDDSGRIARALSREFREIRMVRHTTNRGKGAALRTGFRSALGDIVAVQDADLEYDPRDLLRLVEPIMEGHADAVFGSRFLSAGAHRVLYFWHYMGNRFLTFVSNIFTDLNLTDMETCYKVFRKQVIEQIEVEEPRFGFEPEVVAKLAHMDARIYEMGISYHGRTYAEGKKIRARDGWRALYCVFKYNAAYMPFALKAVLLAAGCGIAGLLLINLIG
jgi:dolichol-phosphate mannosyltransferase